MRVAAGLALPIRLAAARSIAQMVCRVGIGSRTLKYDPTVADSGKALVKRLPDIGVSSRLDLADASGGLGQHY